MLVIVIAAAFALVALAGCGNDSESDQDAKQEQSAASKRAPSTSGSPEPPETGPSSPGSTPAGYWERCADTSGATQVMHHIEDCATAQRVAGAYSRDNPDPEGWRCISRGSGEKTGVHSSSEAVVTCAKKPGIAVRVIRFRLSA